MRKDFEQKHKDELTKIIRYFGINTQLIKLNEEIGELIMACSYTIHTNEGYLEITEEIADVMNLLCQLLLYFEIDKKNVAEISDLKLKRTLKRIDEGYYEEHR